MTIRFVIAILTVAVPAALSSQASDGARSLIVPAGKATIEIHDRGTGPAVVLLPGSGGEATQFAAFAPVLTAAGFRTIAVSVRGAGSSAGPLVGLTLHDYAADVAAVITALKVAPAHILGRAGGNRVARCLAVDRPDLVKSVILVAAGGLVPGDPKALAAMNDWALARVPEEQRTEAFQVSMLSPATPRGRIRAWRTWPEASAAQNAAEEATPINEWWAGGRAPILVIQGLDDVIAPPGNGRALRAQLGERVKLVEIPRAGHALLFEQPTKITEEIVAFLRGQR